ncbi:MAG TPA: prenyltransferase/squalene oxidase repeat-containing protein [Candidatus Acidoferrales bacterium]|nr:prenyltransferase/squalene oxidase repeat-containing protein [Candidatus Acidoferrales bacterium]
MPELSEAVERAASWLLTNRDPTTGGWATQQGARANTLNTAEALCALFDAKIQPGDMRVRDAVAFLLKHQCKAGADQGSWPREIVLEDGSQALIPDIVRTCFVVEALIKSGIGPTDEPVAAALEWIQGMRNADGSWPYRRAAPSALMPTCFALLALVEAYRAGDQSLKSVIEAGLDRLVARFRQSSRAFGQPGPLEAVHTIYATLVFQAARRADLSRFNRQEVEAISWLRQHPNQATRLVEERMEIDPNGPGDYGFLFMTDALLIRVLAGAATQEPRNSELVRGALMGLAGKTDESGGFYGYRVFSWSTAKAISALCVAGAEYQDFPKQSPEYTGLTVGPFILAFALLLAVFVTYLSSVERFSFSTALSFMFLMLAALFGYGKLGEKTFAELVQRILGAWRGKQ